MTKAKEIIIKEIKSGFSKNYNDYFIGFRAKPQSIAFFQIKGIELLYSENCPSSKDAKEIVNLFLGKGMKLSQRFTLNISKGIFIIKNAEKKLSKESI